MKCWFFRNNYPQKHYKPICKNFAINTINYIVNLWIVIIFVAKNYQFINLKSLKVYDSNGCQIPELTKGSRISVARADEYIGVSEQSNDPRYRTIAAQVVQSCGKNYVIADNDKIELNFDTDKITVESYEVATYYDDYFNCNVPYVYDDGLLLEALSWYVLYKILCRGYKHQVFSLTGSEPVNPYVQWTLIKNKASASVINSMRKNGANEGWNNFFYNFTFLPKTY